jgi:hypothetical protein
MFLQEENNALKKERAALLEKLRWEELLVQRLKLELRKYRKEADEASVDQLPFDLEVSHSSDENADRLTRVRRRISFAQSSSRRSRRTYSCTRNSRD